MYVLYEKVPKEQEPFGFEYQLQGYFSRYNNMKEDNLSCFMILPSAQRRGYGKFLIDLSYQYKKGMPERPFSLLGF